MQNQCCRVYFLVIGLIAFALIACVFVAINTFRPDSISIDAELSLDLQMQLNPEWDIRPPYSGGNADLEDRSSLIREHIVVSAQHVNDPLIYIRQHIIAYNSIYSAVNRFSRQVDWVFVRNFGVPVSRQLNSYADVELPLGFNLVADDYRVACKETVSDMQCGGFFLYENYIIYLDLVRIRNNTNYINEAEFFNLIDAINTRIATSEE